MVKYIFLFSLLLNYSCVLQTNKLKQLEYGIKIPVDKQFFRNKINVSSIENIDYNAIYIKAYYVGYNNELFDSRDKKHNFIDGLRFYENGCVNSFILVNVGDFTDLLPLNPAVTGYRGVSYKSKNKQMFAMLVPVTEYRRYGIKKYEISLKGDSLFVYDKRFHSHYIYLKQELSEENLKFKADW
jgi:hypothetical protein